MYKIYIKKTTRLDERYQDKIKLRYSLCLWTEGPNIVKISVLPKLVYRFKAIPNQTSMCFVNETGKLVLKFM